MFENIINFFKKIAKKDKSVANNSKDTAKERLHLVLMQDRANVSADFLELMKQEIIDVIKKYIDIDEGAIDVRLTNKENEDGTNGAPALYANIPIINIKNDARKVEEKEDSKKEKEKKEVNKTEQNEKNEEEEEEKLEEKEEKVSNNDLSETETDNLNIEEKESEIIIDNDEQEEIKEESNDEEEEKKENKV